MAIKKRSEVSGSEQQEKKPPSRVPDAGPPDGVEQEERRAIQEEGPRDEKEPSSHKNDRKRDAKDRDVETAPDSDEVTVTFGEEKFSPVQYQTFTHGGTFIKVRAKPGESLVDAGVRAFEIGRAIAEKTYPAKRDGFLQRLRDVGGKVDR